MAELKTQPTRASVAAFLKTVDPERRADCNTILKMMQHATGAKPKMWGDSIVGFGAYHYKYATGREGDWFPLGFAARKRDLTLYLMGGLNATLLKKLGKHKTGRCCLYITKLSDVDQDVLAQLIADSLARARTLFPGSAS